MNKITKLVSKFRRNRAVSSDDMTIEEKRKFILNEKTAWSVREAYKALRTNLIFSLPDEGSNRIIVSSSLAGEGKSTTCVNLAIAFAETGKRVIIIDCDLRRPNVANLLDLKQKPGITNVLVRMNDLDSVIKKNVRENFDVITSGDIPPNPSELLGSAKMKEVIDTLSEKYDYVFIDTPPILTVTDTTILTKYCSGVLLLAHCNQTDRSAVSEAVEQLRLANAKVIGGIFNGVTSDSEGYKYKYGKYKYGNKKYGYGYGYSQSSER